MFVSLKVKVISLASLLVIGLSLFFAQLSNQQLNQLFLSQQESNQTRHEKELNGLLLQSYQHLLQLSELLPRLKVTNQKSYTSTDIINEHWGYIQINWGIDSMSLHDSSGRPLKNWGDNLSVSPAPKMITHVLINGAPNFTIACSKTCQLIVTAPIFSQASQLQVLQIQLSLADILLSFKEITGDNIGIIQTDDVEHIKKGEHYLPSWHSRLIAITEKDTTLPLLKTASESFSLDATLQHSQTLSLDSDEHAVTEGNGTQSYQLSFINTSFSHPNILENKNAFLIIEDVTLAKTQINGAYQSYIKGAVSAVVIICSLIIWVLWTPMMRLRKQAALLPLLSRGEFHYVHQQLANSKSNNWLRDEIDILDESEMEVAIQLENMQSKIKGQTDELKDLVLHDSLTGMVNRRAIFEELQRLLHILEKPFALLFIDLDNFKRINDSLGHRAGDDLLKIVSKRLSSCVREADIVARLGGDEFCVLVKHLKPGCDGSTIAGNILSMLKNPIRLEATEVIVSASIGIVTAPTDGSTTEELLKNADLAMYRAKALGRNTYQLFDQSMNDTAIEQMSLETELRQALVNREFLVHYQPQIDMTSNRICSVEALVRWQHPTRGLLAPGHFVPALEETGLIVPLGEWVLVESCQALQRWIDSGLPAIKMSVNLSSRQFQDPDLYAMIAETLSFSTLPPRLLELEITESMIMDDTENQNKVLLKLQELGVSVAIDDFGTGYSSFSYLKSLPVDTLKIDRSFIKDIPSDNTDMEITSAIIAVAHKLKLKVVAEGIETAEQQQFLLEEKCDLGQGYLFSKPIAEDDFTRLLKSSEQILKAAQENQ